LAASSEVPLWIETDLYCTLTDRPSPYIHCAYTSELEDRGGVLEPHSARQEV
jgi:hypothetical protein